MLKSHKQHHQEAVKAIFASREDQSLNEGGWPLSINELMEAEALAALMQEAAFYTVVYD